MLAMLGERRSAMRQHHHHPGRATASHCLHAWGVRLSTCAHRDSSARPLRRMPACLQAQNSCFTTRCAFTYNPALRDLACGVSACIRASNCSPVKPVLCVKIVTGAGKLGALAVASLSRYVLPVNTSNLTACKIVGGPQRNVRVPYVSCTRA